MTGIWFPHSFPACVYFGLSEGLLGNGVRHGGGLRARSAEQMAEYNS